MAHFSAIAPSNCKIFPNGKILTKSHHNFPNWETLRIIFLSCSKVRRPPLTRTFLDLVCNSTKIFLDLVCDPPKKHFLISCVIRQKHFLISCKTCHKNTLLSFESRATTFKMALQSKSVRTSRFVAPDWRRRRLSGDHGHAPFFSQICLPIGQANLEERLGGNCFPLGS